MDENVLATWRTARGVNDERQRVADLRMRARLEEETNELLSRLNGMAQAVRAAVVDTSNWMRAAERGERNLYITVSLPSSTRSEVFLLLPGVLDRELKEQLLEGYVVVYARYDGLAGVVYVIYKPRKTDPEYTALNTTWSCGSIVVPFKTYGVIEQHVSHVYDINIRPVGK